MQRFLPIALLAALGTLTTSTATGTQCATQMTLAFARQASTAVTVDGISLFAGGRSGNSLSSVVETYDDATGAWSTGAVSIPRTLLASTVVGSVAMFAGGTISPIASSNRVDIYDASVGPPSDPAAWFVHSLSVPRFSLAATTVGTRALFAGGGLGGPANVTGVSNVIDIYDASMGGPTDPAAWTQVLLNQNRGQIAAATVGTQAIFAGGLTVTGASAEVDIYDASVGPPSNSAAWSVTALSVARTVGTEGSATVGARAYFGGGLTSGMPLNFSGRVDVYDAQTGTWSQETLSVARGQVAATAVGNTVIFAGGVEAGPAPSNVIDKLNVSTGVWNSNCALPLARFEMAATSVGGKALFVGGTDGTTATTGIDVIEPYIGMRYCSPGVANSTGSPSVIDAFGLTVASENDVTLLASDLPAASFGFFFTSQAQGFVTQPGGSQGNLCLGGNIGRYVGPGQIQNSRSVGAFSLAIDLTMVPTPTGFVAVQPGDTWNFQAWYRDANPGPTNNFTDAVSVTFQ